MPILGISSQTAEEVKPLAGYTLWLDASNAASFTYSSGTSVSEWKDRSSNAYTFTQATAANQPSRSTTQNGKSTISFDGSNDQLASTAAASTWKFLHDGSKATVFTVTKATLTSGEGGVISTGSSGINFYFAHPSTLYSLTNVAGVGQIFSTNTENTNTWYITTTKLDQSNATVASKTQSFVNGGTANNNAQNVSPSSANPQFSLLIGSETQTQYYFKGEMAEILIYPSLLSDTDRQSVRDYLNTKWAIY